MYVLTFVTRLGTMVMGVTMLTTSKSQSTSSGEKSPTSYSVVILSQAN